MSQEVASLSQDKLRLGETNLQLQETLNSLDNNHTGEKVDL